MAVILMRGFHIELEDPDGEALLIHSVQRDVGSGQRQQTGREAFGDVVPAVAHITQIYHGDGFISVFRVCVDQHTGLDRIVKIAAKDGVSVFQPGVEGGTAEVRKGNGHRQPLHQLPDHKGAEFLIAGGALRQKLFQTVVSGVVHDIKGGVIQLPNGGQGGKLPVEQKPQRNESGQQQGQQSSRKREDLFLSFTHIKYLPFFRPPRLPGGSGFGQ